MNENVTNEDTALPMKTPMRTGASVAPIVPRTYEEAWRIATHYVKTGMAPRDMKTPERVMIALMAGMEVGLPPIAALNSIAIINNRPRIWGAAVPALAINTGQLVAWDETIQGEGEEMVARCLIARRVNADLTIRKEATFSVADARQAGLWDERKTVERSIKNWDSGQYEKRTVPNDSPWYRYRKRMMQMRARQAFTDLFADVFCGLGVAEVYVGCDTDAEMRDVTPPASERIHNPLGSDDPIDPDAIVPPRELDPVLGAEPSTNDPSHSNGRTAGSIPATGAEHMTEDELLAGLRENGLLPPEANPREEVMPNDARNIQDGQIPSDARPPSATGAVDPAPTQAPQRPQDAPPPSAAPKEPPTPKRTRAAPAEAARRHPDKVTFSDPIRYGGAEYLAYLGQWLELAPDEPYIRDRYKSTKEMAIRNGLGSKLTVAERERAIALCKARIEQIGSK